MTDIPVIGFIIQFLQFLVDQLPTISHAAVAISIPILLAALCGVVSERSGVVNIGLEGMMLTAAFVGWAIGAAAVAMLPPELASAKTDVFGISVPLLVGLGAALLSGMLLALMHAWVSIYVKADQIISGVIINIGALGLTGYLNSLISGSSPTGAGNFTALQVPDALTNLPLIGWLISAIFDQGPIALTAIVSGLYPAGPHLSHEVGPSHACRRRAPACRGNCRYRRHPPALSQRRRLRGDCRARRCLPVHGIEQFVPV